MSPPGRPLGARRPGRCGPAFPSPSRVPGWPPTPRGRRRSTPPRHARRSTPPGWAGIAPWAPRVIERGRRPCAGGALGHLDGRQRGASERGRSLHVAIAAPCRSTPRLSRPRRRRSVRRRPPAAPEGGATAAFGRRSRVHATVAAPSPVAEAETGAREGGRWRASAARRTSRGTRRRRARNGHDPRGGLQPGDGRRPVEATATAGWWQRARAAREGERWSRAAVRPPPSRRASPPPLRPP